MEMALAANDDIFIVNFPLFRPTEDSRICKGIESQNHSSSQSSLQMQLKIKRGESPEKDSRAKFWDQSQSLPHQRKNKLISLALRMNQSKLNKNPSRKNNRICSMSILMTNLRRKKSKNQRVEMYLTFLENQAPSPKISRLAQQKKRTIHLKIWWGLPSSRVFLALQAMVFLWIPTIFEQKQ